MSADEFDPAIERLFARTPPMPDAPLFTADVESRLQRGSRIRWAVLGLAGVVGGAVAVREIVTIRLTEDPGAPAAVVGQGFEAASINAQTALQGGLDRLGVGAMDLSSMGGMQMVTVAGGALIAVAAMALFRLSQEV
ncbi:MAG: hypothetical protein REJ23_10235 [Brevundimonas sp.]|nr:hypothetical protein [Brevundimonas sp.]